MNEFNTNIIDTPLNNAKDDKLDTRKYVKGLARYLSKSSMPTTVAIQGQWGSGKTSFMNQLRSILCEKNGEQDALYYGVWINMWEYSIMQSPEQTLIGVIKGMINECSSILNSLNGPKAPINELTDKAWSIFKKAGTVIASSAVKAGVNAIGLDGDAVASTVTSALSDKPFKEANPNEFRDSFAHTVATCLSSQPKDHTPRRGFMFFIDDLDRINPENAVQILELLKNMFEVDKCIFVLAIDYDVVVKGLRTKFGNNGSNDDRAFRSFFDKIIQMPFTMPVGAYDITSFLEDSLKNISYLSEDELHREVILKQDGNENSMTVIEVIDEMTRLSTGANPRSIKRLINTLSLIKIISSIQFEESEAETKEQLMNEYDHLMNYGLVCLQIAYPQIYDRIMQEPCFTAWDESTARLFRLQPLPTDKKSILENVVEFDEEWEQVVYRICQSSGAYMMASAMNISKLLNIIRALYDENIFEGKITQMLGMTSVTSVTQSENKAVNNQPRRRVLDNPEEYYSVAMGGEAPSVLIKIARYFVNKVTEVFGDSLRIKVTKGGIQFRVTNPKYKETKFISIYIHVFRKSPRFNLNFYARVGYIADISYFDELWEGSWVNQDQCDYIKNELKFYKYKYGQWDINDFNEISRRCFEELSYDPYPADLNIVQLYMEAKSQALSEEGLIDMSNTRIFLMCKKFISLKSETESVQLGPSADNWIRFTSTALSRLIPQQKDICSDWGTTSFYYYEFVCKVDSVQMQFTLYGSEQAESLIDVFRRINDIYSFRGRFMPNFGYAHPKVTETVHFDRDISEKDLFAILEKLYEEMMDFEKELLDKMAEDY